MTAQDLLIRLTRNQIRDLFEAARQLPSDKLDWKPSPESRSALDQLQEVATAVDFNWSTYTDRQVEWSDEKAAEWQRHRSQYTDLDELERMAHASTDRLEAFLNTLTDEDLLSKVEFPFPADYLLIDCLAYHFWNCAYHEGQINYISTLLESQAE